MPNRSAGPTPPHPRSALFSFSLAATGGRSGSERTGLGPTWTTGSVSCYRDPLQTGSLHSRVHWPFLPLGPVHFYFYVHPRWSSYVARTDESKATNRRLKLCECKLPASGPSPYLDNRTGRALLVCRPCSTTVQVKFCADHVAGCSTYSHGNNA